MADEPTTPAPTVPPTRTVATLLDDPKAPEFFASSVAGAAFDGPNIRFTFTSARVDHTNAPGPINNVVNVRIVMSIQAAANFQKFLGEMLSVAQLNVTPKPPERQLS